MQLDRDVNGHGMTVDANFPNFTLVYGSCQVIQSWFTQTSCRILWEVSLTHTKTLVTSLNLRTTPFKKNFKTTLLT